VPVRIGRPGRGFPWAWSVTPWFAAETAVVAPPEDAAAAAGDIARFLRVLHHAAPSDAPRNPYRATPLADRTPRVYEHAGQVDGLVDRGAALALWDRIVAAPPWPGPALWTHGDLHPANLLFSAGRLSAVVDFGDLSAGDPAVDLAVAWMLFPPDARRGFRSAACGPGGWLDEHTWTRGHGWALALSLAFLAHSGDTVMGRIGRATIDAVLSDQDV
jgi:aminoglycoside phosphotransferase (APT) family kinase protein